MADTDRNPLAPGGRMDKLDGLVIRQADTIARLTEALEEIAVLHTDEIVRRIAREAIALAKNPLGS